MKNQGANQGRGWLRTLFFLTILLSTEASSQTANQYIFSPYQEPYFYLNGGTSVPALLNWSGVSGSIPIGFTFNFAGGNYTDLVASTEGWLSFNSIYTGSSLPTNNVAGLVAISPAVFPLWDDLGGGPFPPQATNPVQREARYLTQGTAPNRVFIFEWKNWMWMDGGGDANHVSFQVRLYETSNKISFQYQQESDQLQNYGLSGASIGISNGISDFQSLSESSVLPLAFTSVGSSFVTNIMSRPLSGQVYSFTPYTACSGSPFPGHIAMPDPYYICSTGASAMLVDTGFESATNLSFQWESSINNGSSWNNISNATNYYYQTPVTTINTQYRAKLKCAMTQDSSYSAVQHISIGQPAYNPIPYVQDFEEWNSYCDNFDVPGAGWKNDPSTGYNSWRRDDQGALGGWPFGFLNGTYTDYPFYANNYVSGNHAAFFNVLLSPPNSPGNLDLYLDCSSSPQGSKGVYFYYINAGRNIVNGTNGVDVTIGKDSLVVSYSIDAGNSFTRLAAYIYDSIKWDKKYIELPSNSPNTILRFEAIKLALQSGSRDIGIDSVYIADPCSGTPAGGSILPSGIISVDAGAGFTLRSIGGSMAGGLVYQWERSVNGGTTWVSIPNANDPSLKIGGIYDTTLFRLKITCTSTGQTGISAVLTINVQSPAAGYAILPYIEDFENWTNGTDSLDVPGTANLSHWTNLPKHGGISWRRNDQGRSAEWLYNWYPGGLSVVKGLHAARFHDASPFSWSNQTNSLVSTYDNPVGSMDLMVNCSGASQKELSFYVNQDAYQASPDSLKIYFSIDGGISFSKLGSWRGTNGWELKRLPFISNSENTIIRFSCESRGGGGLSGGDFAIDYMKVAAVCQGQPSAGVVDSLEWICPGRLFYLGLSNNTAAGGLTYQWQRSANGISWINVAGSGNAESYEYAINTDTWFRCIVTCSASGLSDTTASRLFKIAPFYLCYCNDFEGAGDAYNISNVLITDSATGTLLLDNGIPSTNAYTSVFCDSFTLYSDFSQIPPVALYRDTSYHMRIAESILLEGVQTSFGIMEAFIDFDHNGSFDSPSERVFFDSPVGVPTTVCVDSGYFQIPSTAAIGLTGMRVILKGNTTAPPLPCGPDIHEAEDYVVKIDYAPCNGPLNPGVTTISDSLVLTGSLVQLIDNQHDHSNIMQASGLAWLWQYSSDGINWQNLPGSEMLDTLTQTIAAKTWFRMVMICQHSQDTTYSNIVYVNIINAGVNFSHELKSFTVYPNPTDGKLTINCRGMSQRRIRITVMDVTGKELLINNYSDTEPDFSTSVDLGKLAKGIYILRLDRDYDHSIKRFILK